MSVDFPSFVAVVVLLACFVAFSVASFRHFDRASRSFGNLAVRVLTLVCTVLNAGLVVFAGPELIVWSALAILFGVASLIVFRAAVRSAPAGALHVVFTGSGPDALVTSGVYGRIRNPLYTSYLAYWAGWMMVNGLHPASVACFALFFVAYRIAVVGEERFLARQFGDQYVAFKSRTGRFLPRLGTLRV